MHVILLSPASRVMNHYRPPLALMYLSGYLKKNGVPSRIIDITLKEQIRDKAFYQNKKQYLARIEENMVNEVKTSRADIVGITCYTPELAEVEGLAAKIKAAKPNVKIVAGGIHPTLYPKDFLYKDSAFDFAVIGEGELPLLALVQGLETGRNLWEVRGIGFLDKTTAAPALTEPQPLAQELDEISFPDYEDLDMGYYTTASPYAIRGVFTRSFYISSSRGCPSSCTFCVSKKLRDIHGIRNFVRLRSPASLFNEIRCLRDKYRIDSFYFIDDLFTLKKENVYAFCELMKKAQSPLIWGCSSKVNTVDYSVLKAMRDAGCVQIDFGVEKGSDEALQNIKKGITIAQIRTTFGHCRRLGIRTFANMLVNTPGESREDLEDMVCLIKSLKPEIVSFNVFTPYPGCEIYDTVCRGITRQDYPLLMEDPNELIIRYPQKFRFSGHDIDLKKWGSNAMKTYNKVLPNLRFFLTGRYLKSFLLSSRKADYFRQVVSLVREFILQKFQQ